MKWQVSFSLKNNNNKKNNNRMSSATILWFKGYKNNITVIRYILGMTGSSNEYRPISDAAEVGI